MAQTVAPPAPTTALPPPAPFLPAVMSMGGDGMGFNPGIPGTPILPTVMEGGFGGEEIRDFPEYDDEVEVTEADGGDVEDDFAPGERTPKICFINCWLQKCKIRPNRKK